MSRLRQTTGSSLSRRRESGNALIEFALTAPILISIFLGTWQFGYSFITYNQLETAVRAGARYGSLRTYDSATSTPSSDYLDAVRNVVVYANPAGGTKAVVSGLTTGNVNVTVTFFKNVPDKVTVSITNFRLNAVVTSFTLTNKPQSTFSYMGRYAPV